MRSYTMCIYHGTNFKSRSYQWICNRQTLNSDRPWIQSILHRHDFKSYLVLKLELNLKFLIRHIDTVRGRPIYCFYMDNIHIYFSNGTIYMLKRPKFKCTSALESTCYMKGRWHTSSSQGKVLSCPKISQFHRKRGSKPHQLLKVTQVQQNTGCNSYRNTTRTRYRKALACTYHTARIITVQERHSRRLNRLLPPSKCTVRTKDAGSSYALLASKAWNTSVRVTIPACGKYMVMYVCGVLVDARKNNVLSSSYNGRVVRSLVKTMLLVLIR